MWELTDTFRVLSQEELPNVLLREPLRCTANPLRCGESARVYMAQSHIWTEQPAAGDPRLAEFLRSKELQNIAICLEDINHLSGLIKILPQASDYTNKLIGKYIIVEINNIQACFQSLSRVDGAFRAVCSALRKNLRRLDNRYRFREIRNKVSAHRHQDRGGTLNLTLTEQVSLWRGISSESINAYLQVIHEHIRMLQPLAPVAYRQMFLTNGEELPGILPGTCADDYVPFYEETRHWQPSPQKESTKGNG